MILAISTSKYKLLNIILYDIIFYYCLSFQVQELGQTINYREKTATYHLIRKLMAFPFLPADLIESAFMHLKAKVSQNSKVVPLTGYIESTWLKSSVWSIREWSVYNQSVRTNNNVEVWHHRLNVRAGKPSLSLYVMVPLLHREARLMSLQLSLVSEAKLIRYQRVKYRKVQAKLFIYIYIYMYCFLYDYSKFSASY